MKNVKLQFIKIIMLILYLGILTFPSTYSSNFTNSLLYLNDNDDIFGDIEIIKPSNSEVLIIGENYSIKWDSKGGIERVSIGLFKKSDFVDYITLVTFNVGSFEWEVGFYTEASDYCIGIWDYNDFNCGDFSDYFMIALKKPFSIHIFSILGFFIGLCAGVLLTYYIFRNFLQKRRKNNKI